MSVFRDKYSLVFENCITVTSRDVSDNQFPRAILRKPNIWWELYSERHRLFVRVGGQDKECAVLQAALMYDPEDCHRCGRSIQDDPNSVSNGDSSETDSDEDSSFITLQGDVGKVCSLKRMKSHSSYRIHLSVHMRKDKYLDCSKLSSDLGHLLESGVAWDLELHVEDDAPSDPLSPKLSNVVKAHKTILCARSPYFQALISSTMTEVQCSKVSVHFSISVVEALLSYMYTDQVGNVEGIEIDLLKAADYYVLPNLKTICEGFLLDQLLPENAVKYVILGDQYHAPLLKREAMLKITSNLKKVRGTVEWKDFLHLFPDLVDEIISIFQGCMASSDDDS